MLDPDSSVVPQDPIDAQLDEEIASLQSQITTLKAQRKLQVAAILSSRTSQSILANLKTPLTAHGKQPQTDIPTDETPLLSTSLAQAAHNQENLYRACASITTFRIQDPDPNAVDGGNVLGMRIDVSSSGKFVRPYYIMLNKPWPGSDLLRIHRHTVPPRIPLASLSERYLPQPKVLGDTVKGKQQDMRRFIRALRREIIGYHNRSTAIKSLRKTFKLDEAPEKSKKGKGREKVIENITAADAEAKQIRFEWVDGRIGRAVVNEKGEVMKCVIIGEEGRDYINERRVVGDNGRGRMEGIGERLLEGIY